MKIPKVKGQPDRSTIIYNTRVTHVNTTVVRNVYVHNVVVSNGARTSFNGGRGEYRDIFEFTRHVTARLRRRKRARHVARAGASVEARFTQV